MLSKPFLILSVSNNFPGGVGGKYEAFDVRAAFPAQAKTIFLYGVFTSDSKGSVLHAITGRSQVAMRITYVR